MIAVRSNAVPPQTFSSASACATARQNAVGPARVSRSIRVGVVDRFDECQAAFFRAWVKRPSTIAGIRVAGAALPYR